MNAPCETLPETAAPAAKLLPSGRSVRVRVDGGAEELEIRSPQGEVEVRIVLTDAGPVVHLRAARLELESTDTLALRARRVEVEAAEHLQLGSGGGVSLTGRELNATTPGDITLQGDVIRLN